MEQHRVGHSPLAGLRRSRPVGSGAPGRGQCRFTTLSRRPNRSPRKRSRHQEAPCYGRRVCGLRSLHAVGHVPVAVPRSQGPPGHGPGLGQRLSRPHRGVVGVAPPTGRSGSRASAVVALVDEIRADLGDGWFDEGAARRRGVRGLGPRTPATVGRKESGIRNTGGSVVDQTGPVVIYLPLQISPHEERFIKTLAGHVPVTVLVGITGDDPADGRPGHFGPVWCLCPAPNSVEDHRSGPGWSVRRLPMSRCAWSCAT